MVVVDLTEFSSESFDPKRWINASVAAHRRRRASTEADPAAEEDARLLSELEEALRQEADGVEAALERESSDALRRVPMACRDAMRLKDDAVVLRSLVSSLLLSLKQAEGSSAESIAALARIDTVKRRMESAYTTLQDAAGLTQLSANVEDVFASGDLPRAAETLATMRHCLSAVGEVAEFANVRKQLEVLEDRLDEMVLPRLIDALTNRKIEVVQDLRGILVRIGRSKSLELQYTKIHVKPLKKLWEDFDLRQRANKLEMEKQSENLISFSSWLPSFYDEMLLYLEQEWKWCMSALPEDYKSLVPKLLIETMNELNSSFVSRVNLATGDVIPETRALAKGIIDIISGDLPKGTKLKSAHLDALIEMHNMTGIFARNIQHLFADSDLSVLLSTLKSVYSPFETFKVRYGQMERAILSSEINRVDIRNAVSRGVGAQGIELSETVRRMEESIPQVVVLLEASVERCITFTGGSEADELILALDDVMLQYISNLQETLKSLRTVCGVDSTHNNEPSKKEGSEDEEWSIVQGALQILTVADCLTNRSSVFEASLRATLARIGTSLSLSGTNASAGFGETAQGMIVGKAGALDVAALHLDDMPEKSKKLLSLLEQSKDARFHALPLTSQRVAQFSDTVTDLVYTVLISKVKSRLADVARMPVWSSTEDPTERPMPSFSAYPQSYVTSVGEYLLTLPQQLEPLAESVGGGPGPGENNEEAQIFATEWMTKVTEGATTLFMEQLRQIHHITDRGAQQLSADIEYLINVLSALAVTAVPPFLSTYHACLAAPRDQVKELVKSGGEGVDLPTAMLVCKIRRISLD
ncbi:hypothetical protein LUZ60_007360 [Juncus effusus]|nr:hypothetical protein LUZ60_007360 [Juncus effusus]